MDKVHEKPKVVSEYWVKLTDDTLWPGGGEKTGDLEWTQRYGSKEDVLNNRFIVASILHSYQWLINNCTQVRQREVLRELKEVLKEQPNDKP